MIVQTLRWVGDVDGFLELIDQRRLPAELVMLQCRDIEQVFEAIQTLAVRGAPAIGVAASYGLVLGMQGLDEADDLKQAVRCLEKCCEYLAQSRPTGANLFWAMDRIKRKAADFVAALSSVDLQALRKVVLYEAHAIRQEDIDMCRRIGQIGQKFIKQDSGILTHCNAGALATAGQGTALSVIFEAHKKGKRFKVYVDETRPLLQGARLTTWELKQAGIDCFLICDNMAGWLMKQGRISAVITGADRIAANGDVANKVGTYTLSVLAKNSGIPFYVAAPSSTFDLSIKSGDQIPIEQRAAEEVTRFAGIQIAPEGINVCNPAFDITDASLITAIITEKGIIEDPGVESVFKVLK
jgi:methylthioribose-1-phosphate isomerase